MENYKQILREQHWSLWITLILILLLSVGNWYVWQTIGQHQLVPDDNLFISYALVGLNVSLAFWLLARERFAALLLIGATVIGEVLTLIFLLQV